MFGLLKKHVSDFLAPDGIDLSIPIEKASYVVMDTELTGLDFNVDSIVSIGALRMTGTVIEVNRPFYEIVRPKTDLTSKSIVIHQITPSEAEIKPGIEGIIESFLRFCEGAVIVGHFISLDLRFLAKDMKRIGLETIKNRSVDTGVMHEWLSCHKGDFSSHLFRNMDDKDLFSVASRYKVPISAAHNALMDAYVTAQLFQRLIFMLISLGVRTLKDLLKVGRS